MRQNCLKRNFLNLRLCSNTLWGFPLLIQNKGVTSTGTLSSAWHVWNINHGQKKQTNKEKQSAGNRSHLVLFKSAVFYLKIIAAPVWAFVHNSNSYLTVLASDTVKKTEALSEVLKIPGSLKCHKVGGGDGEKSYYPWLVSPVNKVSRILNVSAISAALTKLRQVSIRSTVGNRVGEWMDE